MVKTLISDDNKEKGLYVLVLLVMVEFLFNRLLPINSNFLSVVLSFVLYMLSISILFFLAYRYLIKHSKNTILSKIGYLLFAYLLLTLIGVFLKSSGTLYYILHILKQSVYVLSIALFAYKKINIYKTERKIAIIVFLISAIIPANIASALYSFHVIFNITIPSAFVNYLMRLSTYSFLISVAYFALENVLLIYKRKLNVFSLMLTLVFAFLIALTPILIYTMNLINVHDMSMNNAIFESLSRFPTLLSQPIKGIISALGLQTLMPSTFYFPFFLTLFFFIFYRLLSMENKSTYILALSMIFISGIAEGNITQKFVILIAISIL